LEQGSKIEQNNEGKIVKFFLTHGVFDKPARAAILRMKLSTGYYGCLKCLQRGISLKTLIPNQSINSYFFFLI
jgi:hypothetical protein